MIDCPKCKGTNIGILGHVFEDVSKIEITCFECGLTILIEKKVDKIMSCIEDLF